MHRTITAITLLLTAACPAAMAQKLASDAVILSVAPNGNDSNDGSTGKPLRTFERAQAAVREMNRQHDVVVELSDGMYRIAQPLVFNAPDGGQDGHQVVWRAAKDAKPVISGGIAVAGWKLFDRAKNIWVADVPVGTDSSDLWVDGHLAPRARVELPRADVTFTREGLTLRDAKYNYLAALPDPSRILVSGTGFFTERFSPVARIDGMKIVMQQPSWDNNLWGYDSLAFPYHPELAHLYLSNALAFLTEPGQWYIDPRQGKLYLRPAAGTDLTKADVELPRITVLLSISGGYDTPVRNLSFRGIRFSHTTWMGPSSPEGYASQQSGSYLTGRAIAYPADPLSTCKFGCPEFESVRNEWQQMPASVQVSAAERITFDGNVFAHLGQYALGIGNDADAMLSGIGLGTGDITVTANVFTDLGGGAILAGGVRRDAHHPPRPEMVNRQLIIRNNRIRLVSKTFRDNSAILSTYITQAIILHNDISEVPYDAIDVGYGWGMHDAGGNPNYRVRMHGYDWKANLVYATPTTHRDTVVAGNRVHGAKRFFHDGGAIYNLSASPGTLITENYIFDNSKMIGLYLDEGSRYITVRRNVVQDPDSEWLNINTVRAAYPLRISPDNTADSNWHDGSKIGGMWTNYQNDLILNDHLVTNGKWPEEAQGVMKNAGIEPEAGPVAYGDAQPGAGQPAKP
ncbi:MAG: right-handed parallel beta-helix repeat-containing protein [Acidobacteriaceae bacterium]|nr:right-handed parallel beta-helix repeat-containing protein [Acidobacteriaceae bacterium]